MKYKIYDHQLNKDMFEGYLFNTRTEALKQLKNYHEDTISFLNDNESIPLNELEEFLKVEIYKI